MFVEQNVYRATGGAMYLLEHTTVDLDHALLTQRARIVRLCTKITGRADVAEDLAQETLIEAWRHAARLRDPAAIEAWLTGIARNVCLRWLRRQGREQAHLFVQPQIDGAPDATEAIAADVDLALELERGELALLLDRALALLPAESRTALIAHYVDQTPHAEIAQRLGLSEGAVAVRLHRGKLAFRRVLASNFRAEAQSYGLIDATAGEWEVTRIWCPGCAQGYLLGRFERASGGFALCCPRCSPTFDPCVAHVHLPRVLDDVKGYKAALNRIVAWASTFFRAALRDGSVACLKCGRSIVPQRGLYEHVPTAFRDQPGVYIACPHCHEAAYTSMTGLLLHAPAIQQFWREHPRMQVQNDEMIAFQGRAAILTEFHSVRDRATLDVISAADNYEVLHVHAYDRA